MSLFGNKDMIVMGVRKRYYEKYKKKPPGFNYDEYDGIDDYINYLNKLINGEEIPEKTIEDKINKEVLRLRIIYYEKYKKNPPKFNHNKYCNVDDYIDDLKKLIDDKELLKERTLDKIFKRKSG